MSVAAEGRQQGCSLGRPSALLLAFFLLVLALPSSALPLGNCSNVMPIVMSQGGQVVNVTGPTAVLTLVDSATGVTLSDFSLTLALDKLVERGKLTTYLNGTWIDSTYSTCGSSLSPLNGQGALEATFDCIYFTHECFGDPLEPHVDGVSCDNYGIPAACGDLVSYIDVKQLDCWQEPATETITYNGVTIHLNAVLVHLVDPYSTFTGTITYSFADGDLTYYPPIVDGYPIPYAYFTDSVKVNYEFWNYAWQGPDYIGDQTNSSTMSIWFNGTYNAPKPGTMLIDIYNTTHWLNFTGTPKEGGNLTVFMDLETGYIADDVGWHKASNNISLDLEWQGPISFNWVAQTCSTGHWQHLKYDPAFGALFTPPPGSKSSNLLWIIAVVVCVAAVAGIAAAFMLSPKLRRLLAPFWGREQAARSGSLGLNGGNDKADQRASTWSAARPTST